MTPTERKIHKQYQAELREIKARWSAEDKIRAARQPRVPMTADQMADLIARSIRKIYGPEAIR